MGSCSHVARPTAPPGACTTSGRLSAIAASVAGSRGCRRANGPHRPRQSACSNRFGWVGGSSAYPVTSAPSAWSQSESQPPLKPVWPVMNTRRPFQNERLLGTLRRSSRVRRPTRQLHAPRTAIARSAPSTARPPVPACLLHVVNVDDGVLRHGSSYHASLRETDRQGGCGTGGRRIVDETVRAEPTDTVEALDRLSDPAWPRSPPRNGTCDRRHGRIPSGQPPGRSSTLSGCAAGETACRRHRTGRRRVCRRQLHLF